MSLRESLGLIIQKIPIFWHSEKAFVSIIFSVLVQNKLYAKITVISYWDQKMK